MPGLIDAHTHMMFAGIPQSAGLTADIGFINIAAAKSAERDADARLHERA